MGIQGLLPFLKKIHTPVNVAQFQGCTVAIDAYCWLHKGAFSCADKLALGEKTEQYVYYCMKYVDYLLRNGLKPIMVFDGCHLPSKKDVETSRRERREMNRKRAAQLLREGKRAEAKECLQRCVDITPQMALELMKVCRARGVDCIVAPYEADAQLAYLNKTGIAQIIISEDSDLLLFGCEKVIFKMDFFGNGVLIEQSRLNEVVDIQDGFYTFEKFRYMCILSGCDYLQSLPGIGLVKACKVFKVARQTDIRQVLKKLPSYLKMNIVVPNEYIEGFVRADNTFLYQLAFDPIQRRLCPLNPYPPEVDKEELKYAGPYFLNDLAFQISLGNIDIHTHERIADYDPRTYKPKYAKKLENEKLCMLSIWHPNYRPLSKSASVHTQSSGTPSQRPSLIGKEAHVQTPLPKRSPVKRVRSADDSADVKSDGELVGMYAAGEPKQKKRSRLDEDAHLPDLGAKSFVKQGDDSDDEGCVQKPCARSEMKRRQVLSPSKLINLLDESEKLGDASPGHRPSDVRKRLGDVMSGTKGNENPLPKVNKFAVSALAKRAKFSLDAPLPSNVKVEVKSRYFGSSQTLDKTAAGSQDSIQQHSVCDVTPGTWHSADVISSAGGGVGSAAQQDLTEGVQSLNTSTSKMAPSTARFSNSVSPRQSKQNPPSSASKNSPRPSTTSQKTGGSSKMSPGSAFNWSKFKFAKVGSSPNTCSSYGSSGSTSKPFKRVSSGNSVSIQNENMCLSQQVPSDSEADFAVSLEGDCSKLESSAHSDKTESLLSQRDTENTFTTLRTTLSQADEADRTKEFALQHSRLYSIDSDCFPGSQDLKDLTDRDADGQTPEAESSSSPVSVVKMTFTSPKMKAKSFDSGVASRRCRISGLSRGKKKVGVAVDEKQQRIKDMFSRFAHKKEKHNSSTQQTPSPCDVPADACTPSDSSLSCSTAVHRRLCL